MPSRKTVTRVQPRPWLVLAVLAAAGGLVVFCLWLGSGERLASPSAMMKVRINGVTLQLETARTPAELRQGLGGRDALDRGAGMLFVMPGRDIFPFWMKGMRFPLDIVWLDRGRVVDVATLQPPGADGAIPRYEPAVKADRVLELNAGTARDLGLTVGSKLDLPE